jgi:hypothetical protein
MSKEKTGQRPYSDHSHASDLRPGIMGYGILGMGAALLTIAATVAALQGVLPATATSL